MTDKTPLGKLIAECKSGLTMDISPSSKTYLKAFIQSATKLLPEEKQAIVDAYKKGCADTYGNDEANPKYQDDSISADRYFTQKYKA